MTTKKIPESAGAKQYQEMIMNHPAVMLIVRPDDGQILAANTAALRFYGWSAEKLQNMNISDINTLPAELLREKLDLMLSRQRCFFEFQHRLSDGQSRDVEVRIVPVLWEQQNVLCSMVTDVTERKLAEQTLWRCAEIKNVLREIAETAARSPSLTELYQTVHFQVGRLLPSDNIQILLLDKANGQMITPYFIDETGVVPQRRPVGRYLPEYVIQQRRAIHLTAERFEQLRESGEVDLRLVQFKEWIGAPLMDVRGNAFGVIALLTLSNERSFQPEDVKFLSIIAAQIAVAIDRKRAEDALHESEERLREVLENSVSVAYKRNLQTNAYDYLSPVVTKIIGCDADELMNMSFEMYRELVHPDDFADLACKMAEARSSAPGKVFHLEYRLKHKDGRYRWLHNQFTIVRYADGKGTAGIGSVSDISERRRNERLLKNSYERKKKNELLNDLIQTDAPSSKALAASARMLGPKTMEPFDCFLVVMDSFRGKPREYWLEHREEYQPLLDTLIDALEGELSIAWESPNGLGILYFGEKSAIGSKEQQVRQAKELYHTIELHEPEIIVSVGIAEHAANLKELGKHYQQALVAVHSGRKIWPQHKIHHYLDIGLLQLLPFVNEQKQIADYIERILGNLLRHDRKKKIKLLETLECILVSDNLKESACNLSIHYKTLMCRKRRLEEILGVSLDNITSRMAVTGAVQLLKLYTPEE